MKQLLLLRHAKSSWASPDVEDIDRPLNKRGRRNAVQMGEWIAGNGWEPDHVLCSSSRRTRETWERAGLQGSPTFSDAVYLAEPEDLLWQIRDMEADRLLVIGHNPGMAVLAHQLANADPEHDRFLDFPTASLVVLEFDIESFSEVEPGAGQVKAFLTPHDLAETLE